MFNYLESVNFSATVCDKNGIVLYQNALAKSKDGDVVGKSLFNCHQEKTNLKIVQMIASGASNTYEVVRGGKRRMVHQTPWYECGEVAGLVEIAIDLPESYPIHNKSQDESIRTKSKEKAKRDSQCLRDFAAIDFETANYEPTSVCSVGIVIVRNGQITDKYYSLIKPEPNYYIWSCTHIHGLTKRDTEGAPTFPEVWKEVAPKLVLSEEESEKLGMDTLPLVAHNKAFDERCLKAVFRSYMMDYPDYEFHCTLVQSRRIWPGGKHNLDVIAARCGYDLENHHHALADAEACAAIAIKLFSNPNTENQMESKEKVLEIMKQAGEPMNAGKIAEISGLDRKEVDKAMKTLKEEGTIVSPKRCYWQPAE